MVELCISEPTHLLPVSVSDARVTERLQQRKVLLEIIKLHLEQLRGSLRAREVRERLGELVHSPPHVPHILLHLLSVQLLEWACKSRGSL